MDEVHSESSGSGGDKDSSRQDSAASGPEELDSTGEFQTEVLDDLSTFEKVVVIHLQRLYDLQLALLTMVDKDFANYIASLHTNGEFFGPDPAILS